MFELIEEVWVENKENMDEERTIFFARKSKCIKITQHDVTEVQELWTDHEEADTKVVYLSEHASFTTVSEICIRSSQVISIYLLYLLEPDISMRTFIDNGIGKHRKKIRIDNSPLTSKQQKALIGFHAFTGNDYVSSFFKDNKEVVAHTYKG